jgi:hypothetical protein
VIKQVLIGQHERIGQEINTSADNVRRLESSIVTPASAGIEVDCPNRLTRRRPASVTSGRRKPRAWPGISSASSTPGGAYFRRRHQWSDAAIVFDTNLPPTHDRPGSRYREYRHLARTSMVQEAMALWRPG